MSFVTLGITNVRRNMGRSMLSLVGMALAAMILSSSLPVAQGYARDAYKTQRQFIGGDIIIYPGRFRPNRAEMGTASTDEWTLDRLPADYLSDLSSFSPEYFTSGFLHKTSSSSLYLDIKELAQKNLGSKTFIKGVTLYQSVPGLVRAVDNKGTGRAWFSPLRSRDPLVDKDNDYDDIVTAGRGFIRCDDGKFHALIDGRRQYLGGHEQVAVGSTVSVEVPAVRLDRDGNYVFDYTKRKTYEFKIVGRFTLPTRSLLWQDEMGGSHTEQLYWTTPQILIPQMTLSRIWREVSSLETPPITEVAVRVNNMSFLENNAADLSAMLPQHTVVSVPSQVEDASMRGLPEPVFQYPLPLSDPDDIRQAGTPMDLRGIVVLITYSISALLVASNMLVSLSQRRREIGILKALGARSREIITMVMAEVLFVSLAGACSGFVLLRSASLWQYLSNRMPILQIGALTLSDFGRVIGTTLAFALVFGVLPALHTVRMSAMEVLRNE